MTKEQILKTTWESLKEKGMFSQYRTYEEWENKDHREVDGETKKDNWLQDNLQGKDKEDYNTMFEQ